MSKEEGKCGASRLTLYGLRIKLHDNLLLYLRVCNSLHNALRNKIRLYFQQYRRPIARLVKHFAEYWRAPHRPHPPCGSSIPSPAQSPRSRSSGPSWDRVARSTGHRRSGARRSQHIDAYIKPFSKAGSVFSGARPRPEPPVGNAKYHGRSKFV